MLCPLCDKGYQPDTRYFDHYPAKLTFMIVGRVTRVGSAVTKFKPGDLAAVGCLVDSDGTCTECRAGFENFCPNLTLTFGMPDKHSGGVTCGGYSDSIVVDQRFVLRIPSNLNLAAAAPLLCTGITTYSPMRRWKVGKDQKVGVEDSLRLPQLRLPRIGAGCLLVVFGVERTLPETALSKRRCEPTLL